MRWGRGFYLHKFPLKACFGEGGHLRSQRCWIWSQHGRHNAGGMAQRRTDGERGAGGKRGAMGCWVLLGGRRAGGVGVVNLVTTSGNPPRNQITGKRPPAVHETQPAANAAPRSRVPSCR